MVVYIDNSRIELNSLVTTVHTCECEIVLWAMYHRWSKH